MNTLNGTVTIEGVEYPVIVSMPTLDQVCAVDSNTDHTIRVGALILTGRTTPTNQNPEGEKIQVRLLPDHCTQERDVYLPDSTGDIDTVSNVNTTFDTVDGKRVSVSGGRILSVCNIPS